MSTQRPIAGVAEAKAALRTNAARADDEIFRPLALKLSLGALALGAGMSLVSGGGLKGLGRVAATLLRVAPVVTKLV